MIAAAQLALSSPVSTWKWLASTWPTHRTVEPVPGVFLHVAHGVPDAEIAAILRRALRDWEHRRLMRGGLQ